MKSLSCLAARRLLQPFHDRELGVSDQIAMEAHLQICASCAAERSQLHAIGEALRTAAAGSSEGWADEVAGLPAGVVSRLKAEHDGSWTNRVVGLFDDMHLVWAAMGATVATVACAVIIHGILLFAARERPDSLAAVMQALAATGSNDDPVRADGRILLPRADADAVMAATVLHRDTSADATFALSTVVTREGILSNVEVLPLDDHPQRNEKALLELLDAAATARFEPARYAGAPVAVSMIWLLAQTTVRGKPQSFTHAAGWSAVGTAAAPAPGKQPLPDPDSQAHRNPRRPTAWVVGA